jgi:hypothetical protein
MVGSDVMGDSFDNDATTPVASSGGAALCGVGNFSESGPPLLVLECWEENKETVGGSVHPHAKTGGMREKLGSLSGSSLCRTLH